METMHETWHLGINLGHDRSCALVRDGEIVVAIQQERLDRQKYSLGLSLQAPDDYYLVQPPWEAVRYCLESAGITLDDLASVTANLPGEDTAPEVLARQLPPGLEGRIRRLPSHHLAHAYSAYWPSGFDEALVLVADGSGSTEDGLTESYSLYLGQGERLTPIHRERVPAHLADYCTLGLLYEEITRRAGFATRIGRASLPEAGKLMGLAAYGGPQERWPRWIHTRPGSYSLDIPAYDVFLALAALEKRYDDGAGKPYLRPYLVDLAWKIQHELEAALRHLVALGLAETGARRLCLAGGVALNSVANYKLFRDLDLEDIFIFPAAGDAGIAAGAALWAYAEDGGRRRPVLRRATLGRRYDEARIEAALARYAGRIEVQRLAPDEALQRTAEALARGHVVARFEGGAEFGPRALGHRSILADPALPGMKAIINARVKFREAFRPFAPVVPREAMGEVFERDVPAPFMLLVAPIRPEVRERIPAVSHADGTGRVQTVTAEDNPFFHALCHRLVAVRGGLPVLLNTSFNVAGQPIVETPEEAIETFLATDLDYLLLEDRWIAKRGMPVADYETHLAKVKDEPLPQGLPSGAEFPQDLLTALDEALFHGRRDMLPWSGEELATLVRHGARLRERSYLARPLPHDLEPRTRLPNGRLLLPNPLGASRLRTPAGDEALDWSDVEWLWAALDEGGAAPEALRRAQGLTPREARRRLGEARRRLGLARVDADPVDAPLPSPGGPTLAPFEDPEYRLPRALAAFHRCLLEHGYEEGAIARRLGLSSLQRLEPTRLHYAHRYQLGDDSLDDLIRLFQLRVALPEARLRQILGADNLLTLVRLGLVHKRGDAWAAAVDLFPIDGLLVATDHRYFIRAGDTLDEEPVMYLGLDSVGLVHAAPRRVEEDVLDLCTGSGVQALAAARHARRVIGVDLNPRAVRFARFNAQLNGIDNVEFRLGDLYRAVPGLSFDRILANPPFVPSPDDGLRFRDGGSGGEAVLARIVTGAGSRLRPGGRLHVVTDLADPDRYPEKLRRWWQGGPADALMLSTAPRDAALFAIPHVHAPFGQTLAEYERELERWVDNFHAAGLEAVDFGYLFIHRREAGGLRLRRRVVNSPERPMYRRVADHFRQRRRLDAVRAGAQDWILQVEPALHALRENSPEGSRFELTVPDDPWFTRYHLGPEDARRLDRLARAPWPARRVLAEWGEDWLDSMLTRGLVRLEREAAPPRSLFGLGAGPSPTAPPAREAPTRELPTKTTPTCLSSYLRC